MLRTLLPALLLGIAGPAMAQELDDTTSALPDLVEAATARPDARERGSSRSASSHSSSGGRQGTTTTSSSRSNGSKSMTRTTQTNGNHSRSTTTGTVSTGGKQPGHWSGGEKSRTESSWSNGNQTRTVKSGDKVSADMWRQRSPNGGERTLGTIDRSHREMGPGGNTVGSRTEHTRGESSNGNTFDRRTGVRNETGGSRPAAIPARPGTPGRVGSAPPRGGGSPNAVHTPVRGGGTASSVRVGSAPPRSGSGPNGGRPSGGVNVHVSPPPVHVHAAAPTRVRTVTYTHVRPYHGVFVYGPRPVTHVHYVDSGGPVEVRRADLPKRELDREDSVAIGLKGGSLWSGYIDSHGYSDIGAGIAGRYRPDEAVGLEVAIMHHDQTWSAQSERSQTQFAGSVELFAWPWTRVSPYVLGGLTYTARNIQDEIYQYDGIQNVDVGTPLIGPHAGLGVELALGQKIAIDLEARYVGYLNRQQTDPTYPGALSTTAGLMVHF